ncbi:hypothetical protein ACQUFY_05790 [Robbsia andropogonis]|uniref:hypothetical protein n=1 Tax=Robbsia andropogonis TaxID=28092 RepID=UPI003D1C768F
MLVFRVEDEHGHGPYHSKYKGKLGDIGTSVRNQPTPFYDAALWPKWAKANNDDVNEMYAFAFDTVSSLLIWFSAEWRERAAEQGFRIAAYRIERDAVYFRDGMYPTVLIGDKQVAFWKDEAIYVTAQPLFTSINKDNEDATED